MSKKKEFLKQVAKDSKEDDFFIKQTDSFLKWAGRNRQTLIGLFGVLIIVGAGFGVFSWYCEEQEMKAQVSFAKIEKKYSELLIKKGIAEDNEKASSNKDAKTEDKKATDKTAEVKPVEEKVDFPVEMKKIAEEFSAMINQYGSSKASLMAVLSLANIYLELEQLDLAEKVLADRLTNQAKNKASDLLEASVTLLHGTVLAKKAKCDMAIKQWQKIVDEKSVSYFHSESLLQQAICHEELKEFSKAEELYEKIQKDFPKTEQGREAKVYLRYRKTLKPEVKPLVKDSQSDKS